MPLRQGRSQADFDYNVSTEVKALEAKGVPKKQAVRRATAIAYRLQRGKKKEHDGDEHDYRD